MNCFFTVILNSNGGSIFMFENYLIYFRNSLKLLVKLANFREKKNCVAPGVTVQYYESMYHENPSLCGSVQVRRLRQLFWQTQLENRIAPDFSKSCELNRAETQLGAGSLTLTVHTTSQSCGAGQLELIFKPVRTLPEYILIGHF